MERLSFAIAFVSILVLRFELAQAQCASGSRFGCANCTHVNVCSYDGSVAGSYRCESADPSRPFCSGNTGRCVSKPEGQCIQPSELCPRKSDIFPHPTNCFRYIFCDAEQMAYELTCPRNYVYDHSLQGCKYRRASRDCFQINCGLAANRNQWVSYQPAPRLAVFCSSDIGPLMIECERKYDAFNVARRSCSFRCPFVGSFAVVGDPSKYYSCTRGRYNVLLLSELSCPDGLEFDEAVSSCSVPPTTTTPSTTTSTVETTTPEETTSAQSEESTTTSATETETGTTPGQPGETTTDEESQPGENVATTDTDNDTTSENESSTAESNTASTTEEIDIEGNISTTTNSERSTTQEVEEINSTT